MTRTPLHIQLRAMREKRGMTIEQVARKAHMHERAVEGIERTAKIYQIGMILDVCRALNCRCIINGPDGAFVVAENKDKKR